MAKTVSGIAAAGAPLIGNVEVKDSTGATKKVVIGTTGAYSLDLSGLTPPYMLKADGVVGNKAYTIYSAVTADDYGKTVNITTLTDVIVGNVAGMTAAAYYAASPTNFTSLTSANLAAAETALQTSLQDVITALGVSDPTAVDLLHTSFTTNNQGLDLVLDVLQVTIDPIANTATITNMLNGAPAFVDNLKNATDTFVISATGMPLTDVTAIVQQFQALQGLFTTVRPAATAPDLLAVFDQGTFLWSGRDLPSFLNLLLDPNLSAVGMTFNVGQMSLTPLNLPTSATAQVIMTFADGKSLANTWSLTKANGVWKAQGDQRKTFSSIDVRIKRTTNVSSNVTTISAGLSFGDVEDDSQAQDISYAVAIGKGLPLAAAGHDGLSPGLLFVKDPNAINASFFIAQSPYKWLGNATPQLNPGMWNLFPLTDDTVIATFGDNEAYDFYFYSDPNNTPLVYTDDVLRKRPLTAAERTAAQFPTITGPPMSAVATYALGGTPITVTWTLPAGLQSNYVEVGRGTNLGSENSPDGNVSGPAVSRTLDPLSVLLSGQTVNSTFMSVETWDVPGRLFSTHLQN